ncbi:hypothetical protein [Pedobacter terrae]|uniref:hypothetical protein n=1 Tax=Pedobacter terrae TaxID=405671 RepID=UPI002FFB3E47
MEKLTPVVISSLMMQVLTAMHSCMGDAGQNGLQGVACMIFNLGFICPSRGHP